MKKARWVVLFLALSAVQGTILGNEHSTRLTEALRTEGPRASVSKILRAYTEGVYQEAVRTPTLFAKDVVSSTSTEMPGLVAISFLPFLDDALPTNKEPVLGTTGTTPFELDLIAFREDIARFLTLRCMTDERFFEDYVDLVLWYGKFIRFTDPKVQGILLNNQISSIRDRLQVDGQYWRIALRLIVLAELFQFEERSLLDFDKDSLDRYCKDFLSYADSHRFRLAASRNRWLPAGKSETNSAVDCEFMRRPVFPLEGLSTSEVEALLHYPE